MCIRDRRGAILEGIFPLAPNLSGAEVKAFLIALSHLPGEMCIRDRLYPHLLEIERTAQGRVETMLPHMMEVAGVTEELKACHPMRWAVSYTHLDVYKRQRVNSVYLSGS